jgi:hypothetical protein
MPGARCTRGLVCKIVRRNAHEHTGSAEAIRHSLRNGFTVYAVLSPVTNSSCRRRCRLDGKIESGRIDLATGSLTPATGARTTRFCRTLKRRSSCAPLFTHERSPCEQTCAPTLPRPPHPYPTFVTTRDRPSCRERTGRAGSADLPDGGSEIFFAKGLDRF